MIPLSTKMRPDNLDEFVGQTHFMYQGSLLYNAIKNKTFDSGNLLWSLGNWQNHAGPNRG